MFRGCCCCFCLFVVVVVVFCFCFFCFFVVVCLMREKTLVGYFLKLFSNPPYISGALTSLVYDS